MGKTPVLFFGNDSNRSHWFIHLTNSVRSVSSSLCLPLSLPYPLGSPCRGGLFTPATPVVAIPPAPPPAPPNSFGAAPSSVRPESRSMDPIYTWFQV